MTELTITFDGSRLTLSDENNTLYSIDAFSGKPEYQSPQYQEYTNLGPIPEGEYSFTLEDIQRPSPLDIFLSPFGMGAWPAHGGSEVGWGSVRTPLTPSPVTETFGRDGFFIHGGTIPGSAGCIDVTTNDIALFSFITVYGDSDGIIPVYVSYSYAANALDTAITAADSWTRHDPGGSGGGGGGNGGGGNTGSGSVSDGAGGSLPDTDGNGQADSDFDNTTGTWAAADDGFLMVDLEAANLPAAPLGCVA